MTTLKYTLKVVNNTGIEVKVLKWDSHLPKKIVLFALLKSPLKIFYLILKALFVLKIFKFLLLLFGHAEKTT